MKRFAFSSAIASFAKSIRQTLRASGYFAWRGSSKALRWSLLTALVVWCLVCALVLSLRYHFLPNIDAYRPYLEQRLSQALGLNLQIKKIVANWYGLQPELTLISVSLTEKDGTRALEIPHIKSRLSWASLPLLTPVFASLQIESPGLEVVRSAEHQWRIAGIQVDLNQPSPGQLSQWLLEQDEIVIQGAGLRYIDASRASALPPLDFQNMTLVLRNHGQHHRFAFRATPPAALATPLDIRADFKHRYFARNKANWREWVGEAYLQFDYANWAELQPYVTLPIKLEQAQGALRTWISVRDGQLDNSVSDVALKNVKLNWRSDLPNIEVAQLQGRIHLRPLKAEIKTSKKATLSNTLTADSGQEIILEKFRWVTPNGVRFAVNYLNQSLRFKSDGSWDAGALQVDALDLSSLTQLAEHLPLPIYYRDWITRLQPRGELRQLQLNWRGDPQTPQDYALTTEFEGLSIKPQAPDPAQPLTAPHHLNLGWPGFENLSGSVRMTPQQGRLKLNASNSALIFPGLFERERIALQRVVGQVNWHPLTTSAPGYEFEVLNLALQNAEAQGVFKGRYQSGAQAWVDLQGQLNQADARAVQHYLPLTVPEATRAWVKQAVQAGSSNDVRFEMKGLLRDFPYHRNPSGRFFIGAKIQAAKLQPAPGWPALENVHGQLSFEGNGFRADKISTQMPGLRGQDIKIALADFSQPQLEINAHLQGEAAAYWQYLKTSPLNNKVPSAFKNFQTKGNAKLALFLGLPLHDLAKTQVRGEVNLSNADFSLQPAWPALSRVNGQLEFNESGVAARNLNATFLGGPVRINSPAASTNAKLSPGFQAQAEGSFNVAEAQNFLRFKVLQAASGNLRYSAKLKFSDSVLDVQVDSNLQGVALELPTPLNKPANSNLALQVRLQQSANSDKTQVQFRLGDLQALLEAQPDSNNAFKLQRAAIELGAPSALSLPAEGTTLRLQTPVFKVDAWQPWLSSSANEADKRTPPSRGTWPLPIAVNLKTEQLQIAGKNFEQFNARAIKRDSAWVLNLDSPQVQGSIAWRDASASNTPGRVVARFTRLAIPKSQASDWVELLDAAPLQDLPALNIEAENFELNDKPLGQLELIANNVQRVEGREWQLQKLSIQHPDASFNATGNWARLAGSKQRRMQLDFSLDTPNAGKTLERLGMKNLLRGGATQLQGQVSWRGSPTAIDYPSLSGSFKLSAEKGQFLKVEPGVGRLIGVLSLQSIPKRLTLDFRDVFSEGFAFDAINASVQLQNGIASTQDFKMRGLNATVLMEGSTNLAQETQQLRVLVLPEINAGGASVMYGLLANPAIGLGTFLAQLVLREPLAKVFSYEYQVTGSWSDPQVTKVERNSSKPNPEK